MKKLFGIAAFLALGACTQAPSDLKDSLAAYGLTNIQSGGYAPFSCDSKDDTFATEFTATNAQGQHVEGVVCAGFLKAATVRGLRVVRP